MKKGLSPVIATTLLVLFVIVIGLLIFLWARGFLEERIEKFGLSIDEVCKKVSFDVKKVNAQNSPAMLEIINRGNVDIFQFDIKLEKNGQSKIERFKRKLRAGDSTRGSILLKMGNGLEDPEKATIYPSIVGKSGQNYKVFTCLGSGKSINL